MRCVAILASVLMLASGCGARGSSPITRDAVMDAYLGIDEPLDVQKDVQVTNPTSSLDVIHIPASNIVAPPFTIELFHDENAARARAHKLEGAGGAKADFVRHENAILSLAPSLSGAERRKLIRTLTSL